MAAEQVESARDPHDEGMLSGGDMAAGENRVSIGLSGRGVRMAELMVRSTPVVGVGSSLIVVDDRALLTSGRHGNGLLIKGASVFLDGGCGN
jgi:hypothetical protein